MNGKQLADALLVELDKRTRSRVRRSFDEDSLADLIRSALDPQPEQAEHVSHFVAPIIPPDFPRLRVRHDGKAAVEYIVVDNPAEDAPYATFYIRPMSELESLIAANVPERPKEEWQRRKQYAEKGKQ